MTDQLKIGPGSRDRSCRYCKMAMRVRSTRLTMEGEECSVKFMCGADRGGQTLHLANSDGSPSMYISPEHEPDCFVRYVKDSRFL